MVLKEMLTPQRPSMKVCMMGPKAVGKTTVLTAVFNETQNAIDETQLNLLALGDTNAELMDRRYMLNAMFKKKTDVIDRPQGGITASAFETRFDFAFGFIGKEPILDLVIKDFPGEMVVNKQSEVINFIKESKAVFIAIDTPHLMERNGEFNDVKNKPSMLIDLFKKAIDCMNEDKLMVLIPLKCEKYFHDGRMEDVLQRVKEVYKPLINLFKLKDNICCLVSPIMTLGDVEFDDFTYVNGKVKLAPDLCPDSVLYKYVGEGRYTPLFCSQPLFALLSFVAAQYKRIDRGTILEKLKGLIFDIFNNNEALFDEIVKLDKFRISGNPTLGYEVLCGENLFHYNH